MVKRSSRLPCPWTVNGDLPGVYIHAAAIEMPGSLCMPFFAALSRRGRVPVDIGVALGVAARSYAFVEKPFIALGRRLSGAKGG